MLVQSEVKKWGNSLALRITGSMADIPHLKEGTPLNIEVKEDVLIIRPVREAKESRFPFTESQLLEGLDELTSHADLAVAQFSEGELG